MNENPDGMPNTPNNPTAPTPQVNPFPPNNTYPGASTNPYAQPTNPYANPPQTPTTPSFDSLTKNQPQTFNQPPYGSPTVSAAQPTPALPTEPPKKKKTGLIIGIIVAVIILIGGAVGIAIALVFMNRTDPVSAAFEKIISNQYLSYTHLTGNIDLRPNTNDALISDLSLDIDSSFDSRSFLNNSKVTLSVQSPQNQTFSASLSETYAANGDLYLKIENLAAALESSGLSYFLGGAPVVQQTDNFELDITQIQTTTPESTTESTTENTTDTVTIVETTTSNITPLSIIKKLDNEWIRISTDEASSVYDSLFYGSDIFCYSDLIVGTNNEKNSFFELYKKYPFLISSEEKVTIESKVNPIYKIAINEKNLENFLSAAPNGLINNFTSCLGIDNSTLSLENLKETFASLPPLYVEIDKDHNFTRFYTTISDDNSTITVDLDLSYPSSINVSEPLEYKEFDILMQDINKEQPAVENTDIINTPTDNDIDKTQ